MHGGSSPGREVDGRLIWESLKMTGPFLVMRHQPRPKFMRTFSIIPASGRLIAWWGSFLRLSTERPTPVLCLYGGVVIEVETAGREAGFVLLTRFGRPCDSASCRFPQRCMAYLRRGLPTTA
jgi:hypothetical protein